MLFMAQCIDDLLVLSTGWTPSTAAVRSSCKTLSVSRGNLNAVVWIVVPQCEQLYELPSDILISPADVNVSVLSSGSLEISCFSLSRDKLLF